MRFTLSVALLSAAIAVSSTNAAFFKPGEQDVKLGSKWGSFPIPSQVTHTPPKGSNVDPSACSLTVTVVTTKCAGGPHRWGSMFHAYDKYSQTSWTVDASNKGEDGDLYSKTQFVAKCGTNGRFFPTDQVDNFNNISYQGVRFFSSPKYSLAWVETTPTDEETGEPRSTIAQLRKYHFSDTPTSMQNIVDYNSKFGYTNSLLVTKQKDAKLYLEFCK